MGADDLSKPIKAPQHHKRSSRRPAKVRELMRLKRALDKAQRESHIILIEEFEAETPKGVDDTQGSLQSQAPGPLVKSPSSASNPSTSVAAESQNPEVEWVFGRTHNAKRSARGPRKIFSH